MFVDLINFFAKDDLFKLMANLSTWLVVKVYKCL